MSDGVSAGTLAETSTTSVGRKVVKTSTRANDWRRKRRPFKERGIFKIRVLMEARLIGEAEFPKTQARQVRKVVVGMPNKIIPAKVGEMPAP